MQAPRLRQNSQNGIPYLPFCEPEVIGSCSRVTVIGIDKLEKFIRKHSGSLAAMQSWLAEAREATWRTPQDIRNAHRSVDILPDNRVIFDIKGNHYRLVVKVRYQGGVILIEWIGTHAEYSKKKF